LTKIQIPKIQIPKIQLRKKQSDQFFRKIVQIIISDPNIRKFADSSVMPKNIFYMLDF